MDQCLEGDFSTCNPMDYLKVLSTLAPKNPVKNIGLIKKNKPFRPLTSTTPLKNTPLGNVSLKQSSHKHNHLTLVMEPSLTINTIEKQKEIQKGLGLNQLNRS